MTHPVTSQSRPQSPLRQAGAGQGDAGAGDEIGRHRGKTHRACAKLLKDYKGMTEKVNIFAIFKKTPEYLR